MKNISTREIASIAALASISAVVQLIHIGYRSPQWGMWIDIVAVSWLIAFFLFGTKSAVVVSLLGALIITLFSPDTWLGAVMKWVATVPMFLSLYLWQIVKKQPLSFFNKPINLAIPVILGLIFRAIIVLPLNYYFAIPIWTGMSTSKAMEMIPWFIIVAFNSIQGIIDVLLAWFLVFRFRLNRFSKNLA